MSKLWQDILGLSIEEIRALSDEEITKIFEPLPDELNPNVAPADWIEPGNTVLSQFVLELSLARSPA